MPHEKVTRKMVWKFSELSDSAKQKARDWYREGWGEGFDWWEFVYDDAVTCAKILGIEIGTHEVPLMNGKTRSKPSIWFSGFWSQGDGACLEGTYSYAKGCQKAIREHAPKDADLHRIADDLAAIQKPFWYRLEAKSRHTGHYSHSHSTTIEVWHRDDQYRDIGDAEKGIAECLRDFMDWIYKQLETEHDYQTSDEQVDESITINDYEFNEDGSRA